MYSTENSKSLNNFSKWNLVHRGSVAEIYYDEEREVYWVCYGGNINGRCEPYYTFTDAQRAFAKMTLHFSTVNEY